MRKKAKFLILVVVVIFVFNFSVFGEDLIKDGFADYEKYQLDNGLNIYVIEDHSVPLVKFEMWYKVGSIDEPEGITGMSHMLEHTMFLGTDSLDKDAVHHLIKRVGGIANAGTYYDFTMYYEEVPSAKLELAMAIEADRMRNLKIPEEAFKNERSVVRQERRRTLENNFFRSAWEEIQSKAYKKSGLHHQIIGWGEDIENYNVKKVRNYYETYYAPNNAYMIVTGDVNPDEVYEMAEKYYGDYKKSKINRPEWNEPEQKKERFVKVEKVTRLPVMMGLYKMPRGNHEDIPVIGALMDILVNNPNSRIKKDLQKKQRLIVQAGGFPMALRSPSYTLLYSIPMSEEDMDKVKEGIDKHINDIIENGVTEKELKVVKKSTLKQIVFMQKDKSNFSRTIASNIVRFGNPDLYKRNLKIINNLSVEDIQRVAKKYFTKNNRTLGYVVPKKNNNK